MMARWMKSRTFRRAAISAAIVSAAFAGACPAANADTTASKPASNHYQIKGEMSEAEILARWPPTRKRSQVHWANRQNKSADRENAGKTPLDGWIPDEMDAVPGTHYAADEQQVRVLRGGPDHFPDYISHAIEVRSLVPPFWW